MKKIPPIDTRTLREKLRAALYKSASYGAARREILVPLLRQWQDQYPGGIRVNARGSVVMDKDPDLQWLLKHNVAHLIRVHHIGRTSYTYLQLLTFPTTSV
jgi:hypothetical protein